ncbi:MAG: 4-hydroxy-tetrahydrodipicolinate reductase [Bacilli bacterium]
MSQVKIVVAGFRGRMGQEAVRMVLNTPHFELVGVVDRVKEYETLREIAGQPESDARVFDNLLDAIVEVKPDVLVDLTAPGVGLMHTRLALEHGVRPVVGTTGFTAEDIEELTALADKQGVGAIIAPNFAVGAVLMMKFAQMAARYLDDCEIIEMHHDGKLDAPSGTAAKTAEMIAEVKKAKKQGHPDEEETIQGARGGNYRGIPIHSVRLPGYVAHQEVIFGTEGQTLTIRHDSIHRSSFMSGIRFSVDKVMGLNTLVYGLEHLLD